MAIRPAHLFRNGMFRLTCEILSQGDEVVTGQIADTNAAWLAERLTDLGFEVRRHTSVGDRLDDLRTAFQEIAARTDLCVCTGGLGPTDDDLTAQAVAEAFDLPLELDPAALEEIEERFRSFNRTMAPVNRKQALLPNGSERLTNAWGTAPGFAFSAGRCWFACMPGVPREMRAMFEERVLPRIVSRFSLRPGRLVTLRTIGIGESDLQQQILDWRADGVIVGFRTKLPENHLKLRFSADVPPTTVVAQVRTVLERIGRWVYTIEGLPEPIEGWDCAGGDPAAVVGRILVARGEKLSVAESCTGGRIAAACTAHPGASAWFVESVVTYANEAKVELLGVPPERLPVGAASLAELLAAHGAVSEEVARAMASGIRARAKTEWSVGVTGIAGPGGATPEKPVGTVHIAVAGPSSEIVHRALRLYGDRDRIQAFATASALEFLRRQLVSAPPRAQDGGVPNGRADPSP